jgi:hypothetical protein
MGRHRQPIDIARVEELARTGHTEANIARLLGVSQDTITRRKQDSADFADAIQRGREAAHSEVSNALFRQATRGNVPAITWYEKTRRGFSDRVETEQHGNVTLRILDDDADDSPPAPVSRASGDRP